jgi:hypothetical protein
MHSCRRHKNGVLVACLGLFTVNVGLEIVGCASSEFEKTTRDRVIIDTSFLRNAGPHPSYEFLCDHYFEFLYLMQTGHPLAIKVGVSLVGSDKGIAVVDEPYDELGRAIYETDTELFWRYFKRLTPEEQSRILRYYDYLLPLDWETDRLKYTGQTYAAPSNDDSGNHSDKP